MAARGVQEYVAAVSRAIEAKDGEALAALFRVFRPGYPEVVANGLDHVRDMARLLNRVPERLGEMLLPLMQAMAAIQRHQFTDAFGEMLQSANLLLPVLRNWEGTWALPPLHVVVHDLRVLAEKADMEQRAASKSPDKLKAAASFLMKVFGAIAGKGPKKVGSLYVACQLFKIYFKLGTLNLSKSIIRVIDSSKGFDDYPARDQVTYKYYTGRLDVFNDAFLQADEKLGFALKRCHRSKPFNIRRILRYLVPVRLSLGYLPSPALLHNYQLQEYEGIVQAMRTGDVRLLRDTLSANEDRFLRAGVYLLLEKLELHVYRRLIRKIHVLQRAKDPSRAHQVRLEVVVRALAGRGAGVDMDEMEGLVATLIALGFVKGYLSHKSKVIVLSKQDPFPRLTGRVLL
ncbi:hypothetical protein CLOM_g7842 [Closterium sp. NIES-68]|nr:hypothetical protein CLOM_g16976 [Closterium sp. NIES-68]GJP32954.1 hypothetical protein CLOM_g17527 [Closterium sp. NIES-68]GJP48554.1 hypothetical protein CLOM_g7842 [Closterium sp. NIES-68]GJP86468.1 hypothetical protein CLOP_g16493 [Closterium sp. NIES-67]